MDSFYFPFLRLHIGHRRPLRLGKGDLRTQIPAPPPPVVTVQTPAPAVAVQIGVPDFYAWDGYEYVGVVGDQYYYLGPGHVWVACDPVRLARFHTWETAHADWRGHATVNKHYRRDAQGQNHPWQADRLRDRDDDRDHGH